MTEPVCPRTGSLSRNAYGTATCPKDYRGSLVRESACDPLLLCLNSSLVKSPVRDFLTSQRRRPFGQPYKDMSDMEDLSRASSTALT
jgi:hypothetical protein